MLVAPTALTSGRVFSSGTHSMYHLAGNSVQLDLTIRSRYFYSRKAASRILEYGVVYIFQIWDIVPLQSSKHCLVPQVEDAAAKANTNLPVGTEKPRTCQCGWKLPVIFTNNACSTLSFLGPAKTSQKSSASHRIQGECRDQCQVTDVYRFTIITDRRRPSPRSPRSTEDSKRFWERI